MNESLRKIITKTTADKKKFSLMVGLITVALLMWGRLLLKEVPRSATATPEVIAVDEQESDKTVPAATGNLRRSVVHVDIPMSMNRDLFCWKQSISGNQENRDDDVLEQEKSSLIRSDEEQRKKAALLALSSLVLDTTVMGQQPRAVVNGRLLKVGQSINGFTIKKIMSRSVMIERQGMQFRLDMK